MPLFVLKSLIGSAFISATTCRPSVGWRCSTERGAYVRAELTKQPRADGAPGTDYGEVAPYALLVGVHRLLLGGERIAIRNTVSLLSA